MRLAALVLFVAACRDGSGGGARTVDVVAYAGPRAEPGATVIAHTASGAVIDRAMADAVGHATLGVDDGAFVSVVFPGTITSITPVVSAVTTLAPPSDVELAIHGPARNAPPLVVGVLEVNGPPLPGAEYFEIDVGCVSVRTTKLPEYIDIGTCSMGSDQDLDVLVRGYHLVSNDPPAPVFDGYAAGRARMANGRAVLDLPAWQTSGTPVPVTLDGVSPLIGWTLYADGVPFVGELIMGNAFVYANLAVDATHVQASIAGVGSARITDRYVAGAPQAIAFSAADFLPAFDTSTEIVRTLPFALRWDAASAAEIDAINLRATWQGGGQSQVVPGNHVVIWDAVLPPASTGVTLPALDDDLGATLAGADRIVQIDIVLRQLDSSELDGFAALQNAGIHAGDTVQASTIVPRPTSGQVRVAHAIGLR